MVHRCWERCSRNIPTNTNSVSLKRFFEGQTLKISAAVSQGKAASSYSQNYCDLPSSEKSQNAIVKQNDCALLRVQNDHVLS